MTGRAAGDGSSPRSPLVLDRDELDLTELRRHCRVYHQNRRPDRRHGTRLPRSNADLAGWHWNQHHRYGIRSHSHRGPFVMVRDRYGRTVGQIARPRGWYTGEQVITREQQRAEWLAKHPPRTTAQEDPHA